METGGVKVDVLSHADDGIRAKKGGSQFEFLDSNEECFIEVGVAVVCSCVDKQDSQNLQSGNRIIGSLSRSFQLRKVIDVFRSEVPELIASVVDLDVDGTEHFIILFQIGGRDDDLFSSLFGFGYFLLPFRIESFFFFFFPRFLFGF